jgi:phage baseplate assembly protein gpV
MFNSPVHRATVTYSDTSTGVIKVRIPALTGVNSVVDISYVGRTAYNGSWVVPAIGEQIVVTADDGNLTNLFWVQTNPVPLAGLTTRINELESYRDAFLLGIFN